jgi:hypothetical protein
MGTARALESPTSSTTLGSSAEVVAAADLCGGEGMCAHSRVRSKCKECKEEHVMPPALASDAALLHRRA